MNNVCISLWLKTFYFLNRPLKVILLAKRTLTFLKLLKHISKLLKITQWKEQDTSIYIPQMPFVKFCLLSQQKKKGFLFLFAFLYSVRLNSFFIQSFALKNIHILCEFFSIFFFLAYLGPFSSQYYFTNYVSMSILSTYIIVTLCSTYEALHDFKIWEGTSLWEQQCEHTIT